MTRSLTIALVGEARGEFLFLDRVAERLRELAGPDAALQIEMDPRDLSRDERRRCLVPALERAGRAASSIPSAQLPAEIAQLEEHFRIPSLRRLWRSDLQSWRDGVADDELARQAIGYVRVFDGLFQEHPGLVGGFAEESGRLIKRAFRAVALHHGRRFLIAHPIPLPNRAVFVDQEHLESELPEYQSFVPTESQRAAAAELILSVAEGRVQFSEPRDLALTPVRIRRFVRLARRQAMGSEPAAANTHLGVFARDWLLQRSRLLVTNRIARSEIDAERAVFYPLHGSGDSQITVRGEAFRDQLALVDQLAGAMPYGYSLWVKPHPIYAGETEVRRLLPLLRRHANVHLVHPSVPAQTVLRAVRAVVCVNSTTGFEALMFGLPVVTLGTSLYRGRGLTYDVHDPLRLATVIGEAVRAPGPPRYEVERLIAYYFAVSDQVTPIYRDRSSENARRFAEALLERLSSCRASAPA